MFKKKAKEQHPTLNDITNRIRGFILDTQIPDGHEMSELLGCSAVSDEVAEREEEESDKRLDRIAYLTPLLFAHSRTLAEGSVEFQRTSSSELSDKIPDEVWQTSRRLLEQTAMSALQGSIAQIVDMGLLEIPKKLRNK